jgi:hypothetical protein
MSGHGEREDSRMYGGFWGWVSGLIQVATGVAVYTDNAALACLGGVISAGLAVGFLSWAFSK